MSKQFNFRMIHTKKTLLTTSAKQPATDILDLFIITPALLHGTSMHTASKYSSRVCCEDTCSLHKSKAATYSP